METQDLELAVMHITKQMNANYLSPVSVRSFIEWEDSQRGDNRRKCILGLIDRVKMTKLMGYRNA